MGRVLVTGASGFIGSHLATRLLADGEEVHVLLRESSNFRRLPGLHSARRWIGDIREPSSIVACLEEVQPERIFHCAGTSRARKASDWEAVHEAQKVNVDGLLNLLEAIMQTDIPLRSLVRLGGAEEYGVGPAPFAESQREAPRSAYSASQVAGTHLLQALQPGFSFAAVTVRPTLIYGPAQSTDFLIPAVIEALLDGRPFPMSSGAQTRDLLHVQDLVTAMVIASNSERVRGEVFNIGTGVAPSIRTVARTIGRMMGRTDLIRFGALPSRSNDILDLRNDVSKAERLLGWRSTITLARGLAQTIEWHRTKQSRENVA